MKIYKKYIFFISYRIKLQFLVIFLDIVNKYDEINSNFMQLCITQTCFNNRMSSCNKNHEVFFVS